MRLRFSPAAEHKHREYHAADRSESRQGVGNPGIEGKPPGNHEVLGGTDPCLQNIRQSQGYGGLQKPAPKRDRRPCLCPFPQPKGRQAGKGQAAAQPAAQQNALAGPPRVLSGKERQCQQGDGHGEELLRHLHCGKRSDPVGSREIPGHYRAQSRHRKESSQQPQSSLCPAVPNPGSGDARSQGEQKEGHRPAAQKAVSKALREYPGDAAGAFAAKLFGSEVHGRGADAANPRDHGHVSHRHGQLQKPHPGRADFGADVHLEGGSRQPQQQIHCGEHQGGIEHGLAFRQRESPLVHRLCG